MISEILLNVTKGLYLLVSGGLTMAFGTTDILEKNMEVMRAIFIGNENHEGTSWVDLLWSLSWWVFPGSLLWALYSIGFSPVDKVKLLTEVGWSPSVRRGRNIASCVREIQRMRKVGDIPPPFPNGWFAIAESRQIAKNQVESIQCLGQTFAVFRGDDDVIHVLDAYCPHLGANMGVGGVVKGSCLECPFHGWLFEGNTGSCSSIPYADKVPKFSKVHHWDCVERNGFIFVWHDAEGRSPRWEVPTYPQIENGEFQYRGRTEHHILAHIQEIPENGSDLAHLGHVHLPNIMKGADLNKARATNKILDVIHHEWNGEWQPLASPDDHMARMNLEHAYSLFGGKMKFMEFKVTAEQIGPALVILHFKTFFGKGILVQIVTPQEPLRQKVVHQFYSSSTFVAPIAKLFILAEASHVERDIMIWNNKTFLPNPLLVAEDKLILKFRRWYSQFYSENSIKLTSFQKEDLNW